MSYIGNPPAEAYTNTVKDTFSGDGSTTAFTLSRPSLTNDVRVVVENVIQDPTVAYGVSGTTLTFTSAPPSGTNNIYVVHLGPAIQTAVPPSEISAATTFASNVTVQGAFTSQGIDDNADATAMTIDSSENVLVGKTSSSGDVAGHRLSPDGRLLSTVDGNYVAQFNRKTSDGSIAEFRKDGSTVGNIGAATASGVTSVYAGNDDTALWFRNGIDAVTPFSITGNSTRDAAIDFGQAGGRFKDLYLSGGVYLGGTGSANYLDDYEEGTYSAYMYDAVSGGNFVSLGNGYYTKVGRLVIFHFRDSNINTSGLTGGNAAFFSVPFASSSDFGGPCGQSLIRDVNWAGSQTDTSSYLGAGESAFRLYVQGDNVAYTAIKVNEFNSGAADIYFTGWYFAD